MQKKRSKCLRVMKQVLADEVSDTGASPQQAYRDLEDRVAKMRARDTLMQQLRQLQGPLG